MHCLYVFLCSSSLFLAIHKPRLCPDCDVQFLECIEPVVNYVEAQFERTYAVVNSGEGDLMSLISGSGTTQVDVVFYVILHRMLFVLSLAENC